MKVFRFIIKEWRAALLVLLFLAIQAACEMTLPGYMSRMVDVGIQQGGIDSAAAQQLSPQGYEDLLLMLADEDSAAFKAAYAPQDGSYRLRELSRDELQALDISLRQPMAMLFMMEQQGEAGLLALRSGLTDRDTLNAMAQSVMQAQGMEPETLLKQAAAQYVKAEYTRLGIDVNNLQRTYLWRTGMLMLLVTLGMGAAAVMGSFIGSRTSARIGRNLRSQVFHKVINFSKAEIDDFSTASLITRSGNDIRQVEHASMMTLRMFLYAPLMGAFGIWRVATLQSGLSWIVVVAVIAATLLVVLVAGRAVPLFSKIQKLVDRQNLVVREILTGLPVVRAFTRERHEEERFAGANLDLIAVLRRMTRLFIFMMPSMFLLMNITMLSILWFGAHGIDAGRLQVGSMMAMISYTMYILMAFMMLSMGAVMLPRSNVSSERILEVLNTKTSIPDAPGSVPLPEKFRGLVRFEHVSFRFPGADEDVLHDIHFDALPGQTTAIIGGTGSGKSTVLNLIPRMYDVTEGKITIDGIDVRDIPLSRLRAEIGYIPQQALLFSGDIASNIAFAEGDIGMEDIRRAARIAQAEEFILDKDDKYQSPVSRGGGNVSGGQRQRLAIARAIAMRPRLLLFDDSFSALDYSTDLKLRRALKQELDDTTVLIVAQRIATVMQAEKILVLENGRVVGQGRHEDLLRDCPAYLEIAQSQLSEEEMKGEESA